MTVPAHAAKASAGIGAPPAFEVTCDLIDWDQVTEEVTRLQVRIAKATQAGRWNKVQALQRLLTRSHSGKLLAVKRVTENKGKRTAGVDGKIWSTPMSKLNAAHSLTHRGYQPLPLRRVYIVGPAKSRSRHDRPFRHRDRRLRERDRSFRKRDRRTLCGGVGPWNL